MKAITWLATFGIAAAAMTSSAIAAPHEGWTADFKAGLAQAKKENKAVLVEFTGSDWCPPCIMMRKEVFSKEAFVAKASENFVLIELDYPRADKALAEKNKPLAEQYKIEGYPTVILMDADGKEFSRVVGAKYQTVEDFLGYITNSSRTRTSIELDQ